MLTTLISCEPLSKSLSCSEPHHVDGMGEHLIPEIAVGAGPWVA